jgi:hypothetical protein
MGALVGVALFASCGALGIVAMVLRHLRQERMHRERMALIEKGMEIPPELRGVPAQPQGGFRGLRAVLIVLGILGICIGVCVGVTITVQQGIHQGIGGIIGIAIGASFLIAERMIARVGLNGRNGK